MDALLIFMWIGTAILTSVIATAKGRSTFGWLFLGALFGIFSMAYIAFEESAEVEAERKARAKDAADRKECPRCAELVRSKALACRFCRHVFTDA